MTFKHLEFDVFKTTRSNRVKASSSAANSSAPFVVMPETVQIRNASTERCDMAQGPCACGAWHALEDWPEPIAEAIRAQNSVLNEQEPDNT